MVGPGKIQSVLVDLMDSSILSCFLVADYQHGASPLDILVCVTNVSISIAEMPARLVCLVYLAL